MAATGTLVVISLLLLVQALTAGLNHDEEQYVAAGYLAMDMVPYRDFMYLQTPYYPYLLGFLFSLLEDGNYFLAARLLSWAFAVGSVGIVYVLALRITWRVPAALAVAALFAASSTMLMAFGSARNDIMPCFFALLGTWLVCLGQEEDRGRALWHILGGAALAVAVGSKVSYAFVPLVTVLYVLFVRRGKPWRQHLRGSVLPLIAGGVVGAIPLILIAAAAWNQFLYANLLFHLEAPVEWYKRIGSEDMLARSQQIEELAIQMRKDTALAALIFITFVVFSAWSRRMLPLLLKELNRTHGILFFSLLAVAVPFCLLPRPAHVQYFQPMVPFLMLSVASAYAVAERVARDSRTLALLAATAVSVLPGFGDMGRRVIQLARPDGLIVAQVHEASEEVQRALEQLNLSGKVLTLSPIRVIDGGGLAIYRELATGPFFYRTAAALPADQIEALHGLSPSGLKQLFAEDPPAAVLAGFEARLDHTLIDQAKAHGFERFPGEFDGGVLFVRTGGRPST